MYVDRQSCFFSINAYAMTLFRSFGCTLQLSPGPVFEGGGRKKRVARRALETRTNGGLINYWYLLDAPLSQRALCKDVVYACVLRNVPDSLLLETRHGPNSKIMGEKTGVQKKSTLGRA